MSALIRTVVVDDEPLARTNLLTLLAADSEIEIAGECGSGIEAITKLREVRPDLVFLDVQMPGCDGFGVLEQLGSAAPKAVVFVTAYDRYAVKAFEAEAIDYVLKPFDDARFARVLQRAKAAIRGQSIPERRYIVKSAGRIAILKARDIDWIEAADYYACLHVGPKMHLLRRSLAELEEELEALNFCRIHRSAIVNLERVAELRLAANGEYEVLLESGTALRLSRSHREQLQARLRRGQPAAG